MLRHVVMFSLLDQAEGSPKAENALRIKTMLEALRGTIPEIRDLEVGINLNHAPGEWDLVLVSEFEDLEALSRYQKHPEHVKAGDFISKIRKERAFVDYQA